MAHRALAAFALAAPLALSQLNPALAAGPGDTQPQAWVSNAGSDATGCGAITTPCRSFQYAHDGIVKPGGTIYVKDPANYVLTPPLLIQHAISIVNDGGGPATIVAASGDAIQIQAGAADKILIKGLILDGVGTGNNGINVTSAGGLTVTNTTIKGFGASYPNGNGVVIAPLSGTLNVDISDTLVTGNLEGIFIYPSIFIGGNSTASVTANLTRVQVNGNRAEGVDVSNYGSGTVKAVANQVTASNNGTAGLSVIGASLYLTRCVASGNQTGVSNTVRNNTNTAYSAGDNFIRGNATDILGPAMTAAPLQ
jgi:hypothetical protein